MLYGGDNETKYFHRWEVEINQKTLIMKSWKFFCVYGARSPGIKTIRVAHGVYESGNVTQIQ